MSSFTDQDLYALFNLDSSATDDFYTSLTVEEFNRQFTLARPTTFDNGFSDLAGQDADIDFWLASLASEIPPMVSLLYRLCQIICF